MLPTAGVNRVFGLLDLLRAYNGKTDVANLTIDLRIALDELLPIIDTAEYLAVSIMGSSSSRAILRSIVRFATSVLPLNALSRSSRPKTLLTPAVGSIS